MTYLTLDSSRSGSIYCGREKEEEKTTCCSTSQKQESTQSFKFYWWCWDVILGFVFQYKMMSLIPLQCNALNPDPFLRFSFQRNWSPYKGVEGLHSFTLAWLSKMRRDSINLNQTLIRQRKLFINSICQILWRPDHKVLAKMAILTETLLRFSGFFFLKGQTRAKNVWKSKIWSLY